MVTVTVEGPDDIRNAGQFGTSALVRLQTSATQGGTYADVSGTGSTPTIAVLAATRSYSGFDPNGIVSSWYRVRYESGDASRTSPWSAAFQVGDETAGLICSVYDVQQELGDTLTANDRENVIEKIRQVTVAIEGMTGRWFVPRPLSGTATYRVGTSGLQRIRFAKGIRSVTSLGIASSNQPASGGTYSLASASDYWLDPPEMDRDAGWPATGIILNSTSSLRLSYASFGAEIVGAFGWDAVPADIQGVAVRAIVRRYIGKGGGGVSVAVGPSGTEFLLPDMSGADRATLDYYRAVSF
jgi:hypothetical protein